MPDSEAVKKWRQENTVVFTMRLQRRTDADILEKLETVPSRQGYIKDAIRAAIAREKEDHIMEAKTIAETIRTADTWDTVQDELATLCKLAGLSAEWEAADGETFEAVAYAAAERLGVEI